MALRSTLVLFTVLSSMINGYVINHVPVATSALVDSHLPTYVPEPTPATSLEELRRRQQMSPYDTSAPQVLLAAPDGTCGYISGSIAEPWGCATGNCVFATRNSSVKVGSVLCCDPTSGCPSQPAPTACVDFGRFDYNVTCTGACPTDPMTLKCTSGISRYCNLIAFPDPTPATAYFCNYLSTYSPVPALTTYIGQTSHSFTNTSAKFITPTTAAASNSSANATAAETSTTRSSSSSAATSLGSSGGGGGSKKTSTGVIVGAAIGGVAGGVLLTILGFAIINRRRNRAEAPVAAPVEAVKEEKPAAPSPATTSVAGAGEDTSHNASSVGSDRRHHRSSHRSSRAQY